MKGEVEVSDKLKVEFSVKIMLRRKRKGAAEGVTYIRPWIKIGNGEEEFD